MEGLLPLIIAWGLKALLALAMLIGGWILARLVRRSLQRLFKRTDFDETLEVFATSLVYYVLLIFVFVLVLGTFGVEMTSFIAFLAAGGFAVGLAMQGTLSNFSAGVMLLIFRPFKVGDFVEVGGVSGTVVEIGIFNAELNTSDNIRIVVPNSGIYGEVVKNYSVNGTRRNDLTIGISYGDDIGQAIEVIGRVLEQDPRVFSDPAPLVAVRDLGDSAVNLVVRVWSKRSDYFSLRCDLHRELKEQLEAAGCSLPYPQHDVHLHPAPAA